MPGGFVLGLALAALPEAVDLIWPCPCVRRHVDSALRILEIEALWGVSLGTG